MKNSEQEFKAPWGRLLTGMSFGVIVLFVGITFLGMSEGGAVFFLPLLILLLALPFMVRSYVISDGWLIIKRLGWNNRFRLADLKSVEIDPLAMRRSIRLCGNGGMFSFTGLYRNKKLGNYRCFVNDWNRTVVLRFSKRTIVLSPADPTEFVTAIKQSPNEQTA